MALRLWIQLCLVAVTIQPEVSFHVINPKQNLKEQAHAKHQSSLLDTLMTKMEPRVRPNAGGDPVQVECDMYILSFGSISEFDMDYTLDVHIRQRWKDPRLVNTGTSKPIILNRKLIEKVWNPDLYFPYEKKASFHNIPVPNKRMKVYPDGIVQYSYRVTLTVSCPMELSSFPVDRQTCKLIIESFTYESNDVVLKWSPIPIGLPKDIELPRFNLSYFKSKACREHNYKTGDYSCLKVTFHLRRQFGYYLLQTYVPTSMIVMLSWVEFWINKDSEPARVGMGVGTVLTMATQLASTKNSMPRISYPKAIDVWLTVCMFFVYAAMVEYAFVNTFSRMEKRARKKKEEEKDRDALLSRTQEQLVYQDLPVIQEQQRYQEQSSYQEQASYQGQPRFYDQRSIASERLGPRMSKVFPLRNMTRRTAGRYTRLDRQHLDIDGKFSVAQSIDDISRFIFPIAFLFFNIFYWSYYLTY